MPRDVVRYATRQKMPVARTQAATCRRHLSPAGWRVRREPLGAVEDWRHTKIVARSVQSPATRASSHSHWSLHARHTDGAMLLANGHERDDAEAEQAHEGEYRAPGGGGRLLGCWLRRLQGGAGCSRKKKKLELARSLSGRTGVCRCFKLVVDVLYAASAFMVCLVKL